MKSYVFVFTHASFGHSHGREGLDMAFLLASYDQKVQLLYLEDGVCQLMPNQQAKLVETKNHLATLQAWSLYDVEHCYACQTSLQQRGLTAAGLAFEGLDIINDVQIQNVLANADHVMVF
jgi:tRNA 2-thiouridine synthesizing protein C